MRENHEGILKRVDCRFVWPAGPFRRPSRPKTIPRSPSDRLLCHWMRHRRSPLERVPARRIRCVPRLSGVLPPVEIVSLAKVEAQLAWRNAPRALESGLRRVVRDGDGCGPGTLGDLGPGPRLPRRSMTTPLSFHVFQRRSADPRGLKKRGPNDLTCPDQRSRFRRRSTKPPTKLHEDGVRASWP